MKPITNEKTLLLGLAAGLVFTAGISHANFIDTGFSGDSQFEAWDNLTFTNFSQATYGGGFPGFAEWTDTIDATETGSFGNATFDKLSGAGYPATQSIYTPFNGGVFSVSNTSSLGFDVETVVFQIDIGPGDEFWLSEPVLNVNGGAQALDPDFVASTGSTNTFVNPNDPSQAGTTTIFQYQWDLTSAGNVTGYEVLFETGRHAQIYEIQLDLGDTFIAVVPEPASIGLVMGGLTLIGRRRRRHD